MGCGCASFGLHACSSVPITERKQLRLIPEAKLNAHAEKLYEKVKEKEKLSNDIATLNKIKKSKKCMVYAWWKNCFLYRHA